MPPVYEFEKETPNYIDIAFIDPATTVWTVTTDIAPTLIRDALGHTTFRFPDCRAVRDVLAQWSKYEVTCNARRLLINRTALFRQLKEGRPA